MQPQITLGKLQLCVAEGEMTAFVCVFSWIRIHSAKTLSTYSAGHTTGEQSGSFNGGGNALLLLILGACPLHACGSHNVSKEPRSASPREGQRSKSHPHLPRSAPAFPQNHKNKSSPLLSPGGLGNRESEKAAAELVSPLPPSPLSNNPLP